VDVGFCCRYEGFRDRRRGSFVFIFRSVVGFTDRTGRSQIIRKFASNGPSAGLQGVALGLSMTNTTNEIKFYLESTLLQGKFRWEKKKKMYS
jgi:hypothetical protein